jgi:HEAT repeat protein
LRVVDGLETTLALLTKTENEAAVRVLLPALDSTNSAIQEGALVALLRRPNPAGGREILDRMPRMKPEWKSILMQHHGRLTRPLRDALLGTDARLCENACNATVLFREYDLIPTLLMVLEGPAQPHADMAARTVIQLVESLYDHLAGSGDALDRRDPQLIRRYVLSSLEQSVGRFSHHRRQEIIEGFLLLVNRDNVTLKQILQDPGRTGFSAVHEVLSKSSRRGVIRLVLSFLDDPHPPGATEKVIAARGDVRFLHYLLKKIGREPSPIVAKNLKRLEAAAWLGNGGPPLDSIDDAGQHALVRLAMVSGLPRPQVLELLRRLLQQGKPGGRREAARALAEFHGADANNLALEALDDPDPQVQANIVLQLRGRGIPGTLPRLLELIESRYEVVRRAARESLGEFNFKRYAAAFDILDEEVRRSTGVLVRKIDPHTPALLREEMTSPVRSRRLRGLAIARTIGLVDALEDAILPLLEDEDHIVRVEAATSLAHSSTATARAALEKSLGDTSEVVRQAAHRSLQEIAVRPNLSAPMMRL